MSQDLEPLRAAFAKEFEQWGVTLPEEDVRDRRPGYLKQANGSGSARYAWGSDERGEYVEFYAFHRIWGDYHARIYANGETEPLPTLITMYAEGDDPETTERNRQEMVEQNRTLLADLEAAGLLAAGPVPVSFTINAALTTDVLPDKPAE
ncbi:MAG: hypothetical protein LC808_24860 [Actinobacteria bacterium]|nr:hypothetical protein [Actinomycetota bacterium]